MPLIAALTPPEHEVSHTDEIVERVRFDAPADLVGITAPTPSALHAYDIAREFRRRGVPVVIGGPHATALPEEAARHADGVVVGEAEDTWPRVLDDARRGKLEPVYVSTRQAPLAGMPAPRWDLIKGRRYGKSVTIATRGCPHRCDYCSIPLLYGPGTMSHRPIDEVVREVATSPTRAVVFWDDNIGANPRHAKELFRALTPPSSLPSCRRRSSRQGQSGSRAASTRRDRSSAGSRARARGSGGISPGTWATCSRVSRTRDRRGIRPSADVPRVRSDLRTSRSERGDR